MKITRRDIAGISDAMIVIKSDGITTTGFNGLEDALHRHIFSLRQKARHLERANTKAALKKYGVDLLMNRIDMIDGRITGIRKSISECLDKLRHPGQQKIA